MRSGFSVDLSSAAGAEFFLQRLKHRRVAEKTRDVNQNVAEQLFRSVGCVRRCWLYSFSVPNLFSISRRSIRRRNVACL